jgi:hypothetical protein
MSISTFGWGAYTSSISSSGWGSFTRIFLPELLASYIQSSSYICVLSRDYIEVTSRTKGTIVLRVRSDSLSLREKSTILERAKGIIIDRSDIC